MSDETVILPNLDEDRTVIDTRFAKVDVAAGFAEPIRPAHQGLPFEASGRAESSRPFGPSPSWARTEGPRIVRNLFSPGHLQLRTVVQALVVVALAAGIGALAYQQSQLIEALRRSADEFSEVRLAPHRADLRDRELSFSRSVEPPTDLQVATTEPLSEQRDVAESRAAALIEANDFAGAIVHYQELARRFPNDRAIRDLVAVLRTKLSCEGSARPTGAPCP